MRTPKQLFKTAHHIERLIRWKLGHSEFPRYCSAIVKVAYRVALAKKAGKP